MALTAVHHERGLSVSILRLFAGALFLMFAIAAGITLGGRWLGASNELTPERIQQRSYLEIGDTIPDYSLHDPISGEDIRVSDLWRRGPLLLILAGMDCPHCKGMMKRWPRMVIPELASDIQIVLLFGQNDWSGKDVTANGLILPRMTAYVTDRETQVEEDGLAGTPTVVGIGEDGRIRFISPGDNPGVGSKFINKYIR